MKKLITVIIVCLLLGMAAGAHADGTKISVAIKGWQNSWEEEDDLVNQTYDFGSALMVGPSINIRFSNNVFVGGTYMVSTSDYETNNFVFVGDTLSVERKDMDLFAGYMFTPYFGAFIGYKSIDGDAKYSLPPSINDQTLGTLTISGPGIGITGGYPLGEIVSLYGNLALMFMDYEFKPSDGSPSSNDDVGGASFEFGLAFALGQTFAANVGYKAQSFSGDNFTDTFKGVAFGVTATF